MQEWRETVSPAGLVQQAKMDGINISEYSVRQLVKSGAIPARFIGRKILIPYSAFKRYILCEESADNKPTTVMALPGIRRVDL